MCGACLNDMCVVVGVVLYNYLLIFMPGEFPVTGLSVLCENVRAMTYGLLLCLGTCSLLISLVRPNIHLLHLFVIYSISLSFRLAC